MDQFPDLSADSLVPRDVTGLSHAEPVAELLVHDSLNVLCTGAGPKTWENRTDFGLVLVGIIAEVDALRIPGEEHLGQPRVQLAVLVAKRLALTLDPLPLVRHVKLPNVLAFSGEPPT